MIVIPFENGEIFRRGLTKAVFVPAELRAVLEERYAKDGALRTSKKGIEFYQGTQAIG
jgi:hypothetical protein